MKRTLAILLATSLLFLAGCGDVRHAQIDYGESALYSQADREAAVRVIQSTFRRWKGCRLDSICYTSDACNSPDTIAWMNELGGEGSRFTQCICFTSDFHTPERSADVWEADAEYTGWQWWLARTEGGSWKLMTYGYG